MSQQKIEAFKRDIDVALGAIERSRVKFSESNVDEVCKLMRATLLQVPKAFGSNPVKWSERTQHHFCRLKTAFNGYQKDAEASSFQVAPLEWPDEVTLPGNEESPGQERGIDGETLHTAAGGGDREGGEHGIGSEHQLPIIEPALPGALGGIRLDGSRHTAVSLLGGGGLSDGVGAERSFYQLPGEGSLHGPRREGRGDADRASSSSEEGGERRAPGRLPPRIRGTGGGVLDHETLQAALGEKTVLENNLDHFLDRPGRARSVGLLASRSRVEGWVGRIRELKRSRQRWGIRDAALIDAVLADLDQILAVVEDTLKEYNFGKMTAERIEFNDQTPQQSSAESRSGSRSEASRASRSQGGRTVNSGSSRSTRRSAKPDTLLLNRTPVRADDDEEEQRQSGLEGGGVEERRVVPDDYAAVSRHVVDHLVGKETLEHLPSFSGGTVGYYDWRQHAVHLLNKDRRGSMVKLAALKNVLKGEALKLASRVSPTTRNPVKAVIDLLDKHYDQPGAVLHLMMKELEAVKGPSQDNPNELETFVDVVRKTIQKYHEVGERIGDQFWFFEIVFEKIKGGLRHRFLEKYPNPTTRRVKDLLRYLEKKENVLRSDSKNWKEGKGGAPGLTAAAAASGKPQGDNKGGKGGPKSQGKGKTGWKSYGPGPYVERERPKEGVCPCCLKPDHGAATCPVFAKKPAPERLFWAWAWFLCFRCLKYHSRPEECKQPADYVCTEAGCQRKHHTLLHDAGGVRGAKAKYLPGYLKQRKAADARKTGEKTQKEKGQEGSCEEKKI